MSKEHTPLYPMGVARRLSGLSERQLRYWEEQGIITPGRSPGGHRLYSQADLDLLERAALMRQRGYGLDDIRRSCTPRPPASDKGKPHPRSRPYPQPKGDTPRKQVQSKQSISTWRDHFPATTRDRVRIQTELDRRKRKSHKEERDTK